MGTSVRRPFVARPPGTGVDWLLLLIEELYTECAQASVTVCACYELSSGATASGLAVIRIPDDSVNR